MEILYWVLLIVGGFLLGSIMFSAWLPKALLKKDICEISVDNNPGAFNVFKHFGIKIGLPCMTLDVLKGFIPVFLAGLLLDTNNLAFVFVMFAPALGHAIGMFNRFHGGKCIATSFGVMFGLIPVTWIGIVALAVVYLLFTWVIKIENGAVRSVVVYAVFAVISSTVLGLLGLSYAAAGCGMVALLPIIKFLCSKNGLVKNDFKDKTVMDDRVCKNGE